MDNIIKIERGQIMKNTAEYEERYIIDVDELEYYESAVYNTILPLRHALKDKDKKVDNKILVLFSNLEKILEHNLDLIMMLTDINSIQENERILEMLFSSSYYITDGINAVCKMIKARFERYDNDRLLRYLEDLTDKNGEFQNVLNNFFEDYFS